MKIFVRTETGNISSNSPTNFKRRMRENKEESKSIFISKSNVIKDDQTQMNNLNIELENQQSIELRRILYQKYQVLLSHEEEEDENSILKEKDEDIFKTEYERPKQNKLFAVVEMDFNDKLKIDLEDHIMQGEIKNILASLLIIKRFQITFHYFFLIFKAKTCIGFLYT